MKADLRFLGLKLALRQRKAFIIIGFLLLTAFCIKTIVHHLVKPEIYVFSKEEKDKLQSLSIAYSGQNDFFRDRKTYRNKYKENVLKNERQENKKWFVFDPNTATEDELEKLPLPKYIVNNIIKYRATGARFKSAEQFSRIYGIAPYIDELEPYLKIETSINISQKAPDSGPKTLASSDSTNLNSPVLKDTLTTTKSSTASVKPKKEKDIVVDINSATEYELMMVPGVGQWYSKKLLEVRDRMGGFLSKDQIYELSGIPSERLDPIMPHINVNPASIQKWKINKAMASEIYRHPYLSNRQAKILILYRENHRGIKDADDLRKIKIFTEQEVQRLLPYLDFSL